MHDSLISLSPDHYELNPVFINYLSAALFMTQVLSLILHSGLASIYYKNYSSKHNVREY